MADTLRNIEQLCTESGIDARQLAERSNVDEQRVLAIVLGRWTPSPPERDRIAAVIGLTRDQVLPGATRPPSSTSTARGRRETAPTRVLDQSPRSRGSDGAVIRPAAASSRHALA
jgi:transcriptional regulator with XRE-family HTH domain